jgi:hypothetical protein
LTALWIDASRRLAPLKTRADELQARHFALGGG